MVVKDDGRKEVFEVQKLHGYLTSMLGGLNKNFLDIDIIVEKVRFGLPNGKNNLSHAIFFLGVKTSQITDLCAETCAYMAIVHPDYTILANRISVRALHKRTSDDIRVVAESLY